MTPKYSFGNEESRRNLPPKGGTLFYPGLMISIRSSVFRGKNAKARLREVVLGFPGKISPPSEFSDNTYKELEGNHFLD